MNSFSPLRRFFALLTVFMLLGGYAMAETQDWTKEAWYAQALKASEMAPGNNFRLNRLIARAKAGENITLALVGGSVTEGAGAPSYETCWASLFAGAFAQAWGLGDGSNVTAVNAGVGGTPSLFGYMRYQRDVLDRVGESDPDGLPDLVVLEYAINDWGDPSGHRGYESLVRDILQQPNHPVVILLFSVAKTGWNLQDELRRIGDACDLMMVSVKDGIIPRIGSEVKAEDFFTDDYHPTGRGHRFMANCLMQALSDALAAPADEAEPSPDAAPAYGTDFLGLQTFYGSHTEEDFLAAGLSLSRGGFTDLDINTYRNRPVGWVCGKNFFHDSLCSMEPLTVTGVFSKCLIAWKAAQDASFGSAEVLVDGQVVQTLKCGQSGQWGQSEVLLALDQPEAAEHTLEIRVTEKGKKFTVTALAFVK